MNYHILTIEKFNKLVDGRKSERLYQDIIQLQSSIGAENNLFEKENTKLESFNMPIIDLFEREFKRPLSAHEIDKLNDWLMKVDHAYLVHALREALIYQKLNFNYIDRILVKWLDNKVSLQDLDAGKK